MADEPRGYTTTDDAQKANEETWRKFRKDFQQEPITYGAILVLIALAILVLGFRVDFMTTIAPQLLSIAVIVFLVNELQKRRELKHKGLELLADVKHGSNTESRRAINRMHEYSEKYDWLYGDGSLLAGQNLTGANLENTWLEGVNLRGANLHLAKLQEADFWEAEMQDTDLSGAYLQKAQLDDAKLTGSNLSGANLQAANMSWTNLERANLSSANLEDAQLPSASFQDANLHRAILKNAGLIGTNLSRADLTEANLLGADFTLAHFSAETVLPDKTHYDLQKGLEQLDRFTNPNHPVFWQPDWVR